MRATVRVGIYTGAKVYFVHEVKFPYTQTHPHAGIVRTSIFWWTAGLPGSGGRRRSHPLGHLGECVHDAPVGK